MDFNVIIIGSGFGGMTAAVNLRKKGIEDFILLERRGFPGGTWCQNTYPGAAVDVQSPLYSLSFEPYPWTQMFAGQAELKKYTEHLFKKYKLTKKTILNTTVRSIHWQESTKTWCIETADGKVLKSRFVINTTGALSTPVIPEIEGLAKYQGKYFHTNQWDHSYKFADKKVAVIGSGASAVQVIPAIADQTEHLYIFQRTPHWILPRPDYKFSPFQQKMLRNKFIYFLIRAILYWALEFRIIAFKYSPLLLNLIGTRRALNFLRKQIKDPLLRQKLTPDFTIGCKRILISNTYYPTLLRKDVTLLFKEQGIKQITKNGIETLDGQKIDLDLIVFATGFDASGSIINYPVTGRDGKTLQNLWADFPRAYLGVAVPDFPNFFIVTGPNTLIGHTSALFIIESQMNYISDCISKVLKRDKLTIEVRPEVEEEYTSAIHKTMEKTVWAWGGCKSWYQNKAGKVIALFPGFSFNYYLLSRRCKEKHHKFS